MVNRKKDESLSINDKINIRKEQMASAPKKIDENITKVTNRLKANIEAKDSIEKLLHGEITRGELAYSLAEDDLLRDTMQKVTEGMINPEPIASIKAERSPVAFDSLHGISVFWDEMRVPIDQKVDLAVDVKNIADQVEMGVNKNLSPKARRSIFSDLGVAKEDMSDLVTREDDLYYQKEVVDHYRNEHMERLGLKESDVLDPADEILIDNLVEDSLAMPDGYRLDVVPDKNVLVDPYVEEYGMTAEELITSFGYGDDIDKYDYPAYEDLDTVDKYPSMKFAIEEYERIHDAGLEDNISELEEIERIQSVVNSSQLSEDDLKALETDALGHDLNSQTILSEDDLRTLNDWDNLEM